ncbi:MAG: chromosome segregation protein SMC [Clostridia bacterium]|nr:chromosome segregation protein SMC [Clostridia bacterium]
MYLKSLELHGFKSFPNKTVLNFEPGATVVIGPNGSGKSNISDAMRWVLGEISSKNIRGTKMEDVIFGGADSRKPMSFAEVSVTFDNSGEAHRIDVPYDEITVTRRYYRSGESEYFINRKAVRLKDIHELFMNTGIGRDGYSVIGQGKIAEILSRKGEDRRNVFEEAAGIAKYRYKKHEAEKKLSAADDNLVRLTDIANELGSRVGPLEKESVKAKKYLEIYEGKKRADVSLWLYDSEVLKTKITEAEKALELSAHELEVAEDSLRSLETQSDKLFEESQQGKMVSEKLLTEINYLKEQIHKADSDIKVAENEIAHKKELLKQSENAIDGASTATDSVKAEFEEVDKLFVEKQSAIKDTENERAQLIERHAGCGIKAAEIEKDIDEKQAEVQRLHDLVIDIKVRINVLENAIISDNNAGDQAEIEIIEYEKEAKKISDEISAVNKEIDSYNESSEKTEQLIDELTKSLESAENERDDVQAAISEKKLSYDGLVHRAEALQRMEELFEGYSSSVRYVMQAYSDGKIRGGEVYGPVSKLISVPEKYVTAIETAFGANIQNIAVENEDVAKSAIRVLKDARAGRATFYPLTSATAQDETEEMIRARKYNGYIGRADLLFDYDPKFSEVMRSILGRTLVFDTLDNASVMAREQKYHVKVVTLDGQIINAGGSYTGGSVRRDSGILTRTAEIRTLRKSAEETKKELDRLDKQFVKSQNTLKDAQTRLAGAVQQKEILNTLITSERAHIETLTAKLSTNTNLCEKLRADLARIKSQNEGNSGEIAKLTEECAALESRIEEIKKYRANRDSERNDVIDEQRELDARISEIAIKIAEANKDIEALDVRKTQLGARLTEIANSVMTAERSKQTYLDEIAELEKSNVDTREAVAQMMTKFELLSEQRGSVENDTTEYERRLNDTRLRIREKNSQKEVVLVAHNKNDARLRALRAEQDKASERMYEEYELTFALAMELGYPPLSPETRPSVASAAAEYRKEMKSLGPVHVGAIEEYAEVKSRYDEMSVQIEDLKKSKSELTSVINRLENEMRGQFMDAFNQINKNFSEVFSALFGGGTAELSLTEPEDVLTSGIEIKAAPPGKIIKSLTLLSGGEQAFVAIALFFAILKVNPSPFCILDEIEAALDEVNVNRFADYVKQMSANTQFVLITHRRGTMEAADRIYGVTMPERGISKVLSLNVGDIDFKL